MCILFIAYCSHPRYQLIIGANRDEHYMRPTALANFWPDEPSVLAGRDLEKFGTWMGVNMNGRFSALTNFRDPNEQVNGKQSRGHIVRQFLTSVETPAQFLKRLQSERTNYPGYNVLVSDLDSFMYYSNNENKIKQLQPGVYGLSNHLLDTPWPKVEKGKRQLQQLLKHKHIDKEDLFRLLSDADPAPTDQLPNTGIPIELEKKLSSIFIQTENYGTRSSTIFTVDYDGSGEFIERTHLLKENNERSFQFKIK